MSELTTDFFNTDLSRALSPPPDFRKLASSRLGYGDKSPFADLYAGVVELGADEMIDALPAAAIIWNKKTDRFAITFVPPRNNQHVLHRLGVHFFHEGYEPVKDSGAFMPVAKIAALLPPLQNKDYTVSPRTDRIIDNLTHAQVEALVASASALNKSLKLIRDFQRSVSGGLKLTIDNAFANKSAPSP